MSRSGITTACDSDKDVTTIGRNRTTQAIIGDRSSSGRRASNMITSELKSTLISSMKPKNKFIEEEMTINQLRFDSLGLYGRSKESQLLQDCLHRLQNSNIDNNLKDHRHEVVLVKGFSGTGKSTLCQSALAKSVQKMNNGLFVTGKFDLYLRDEPYSGISSACEDLCTQILSSSSTTKVEEVRNQILEQLGGNESEVVEILIDIIPNLNEILTPTGSTTGEEYKSDGDEQRPKRTSLNAEAKSQLVNYAFRMFLGIMSSTFSPLVIMLDDLQWADAASLELINVIVTDRGSDHSSKIMIVGCYRSNEIVPDDMLSKLIDDLREQHGECHTTTEMEAGNLGLAETNQVLMALLSIDNDDHTLELAELCYQRTLGNVFFLIQFLVMLKEEKLIEFHLGLFRWKWDISTIRDKTAAAENVVQLVKLRMEKLPSQLLFFLQLVACIGSEFAFNTAAVAWNALQKQIGTLLYIDPPGTATTTIATTAPSAQYLVDDKEAGELLYHATENGFLEECGPSIYRWLHDKIREAALAFMVHDATKLAKLKYEISMSLVQGLTKEELASEIFVVVNLLNDAESQLTQESDNTQLATLNLEAAEKAKLFAAYQSAAKYAKTGISKLPKHSCWNTPQFDIALRLYSIGAEAFGYIGNAKALEACCGEVLKQNSCSILEKLRAYNALIDYKGNTGNVREAIDIGFSVLRQLGCHFPRTSAVQVVQSLAGLMKAYRKPPTSDMIDNLPLVMKDRTKVECMKIMFKMGGFLYYTSQIFLYILVGLRAVGWTLEEGISEYCEHFFLGTGVGIFAMTGDLQASSSYAEMASQVSERLGDKRKGGASRVAFGTSCILGWTKPIQSFNVALSKGYKTGMQVGDTESASWCLSHSMYFDFLSGRSLKIMDANCRRFIPQMNELRRIESVQFTSALWQCVLNLMDRPAGDDDNNSNTKNSIEMAGEAFGLEKDEETVFAQAKACYLPSRLMLEALKNMLCVYFNEYEVGADMAMSRGVGGYLKHLPVMHLGMWDMFLKGVCLLAAYRIRRKGKYKRHGLKARAAIKSWVKQGNPNVVHHLALLDAEYYAIKGKLDEATKRYEDSVVTASRGGFIHDAALANERYADFCIDVLEGEESNNEAKFRVQEAIRLYSEWGAEAKVRALRRRYSEFH